MSKKNRNYFDDIKNTKAYDKFIEHIIRLFFFAVVLGIEAVYKKIKEILFHFKNILKRRTLSDVLKKYSFYKQSINSMIHNHVTVQNLHDRIHDTVNRLFSDEKKKLVFGIKNPGHIFLEKSKHIITSVTGYTRSIKGRYFKYKPFAKEEKKYPASMLTIYILKKYKNHKGKYNLLINPEVKKKFTEIHSSGYKKFINDTFTRFYSSEFKQKIKAGSLDIDSMKPQIKKIFNTIKKLERKQVKFTFGQS